MLQRQQLIAIVFCAIFGCGKSEPVEVGPKATYQQHCARCHARAGEPGGPGLGGSKGPSLAKMNRSADWLVDYIRDPKSKIPDAKMMPAFGGTLTDEEIRALADWLAAKK